LDSLVFEGIWGLGFGLLRRKAKTHQNPQNTSAKNPQKPSPSSDENHQKPRVPHRIKSLVGISKLANSEKSHLMSYGNPSELDNEIGSSERDISENPDYSSQKEL